MEPLRLSPTISRGDLKCNVITLQCKRNVEPKARLAGKHPADAQSRPLIQKCGHMKARHLSVQLPKIQSLPVSSSTRQSRRLCVVRPERIVLGYRRSAHGGDTMNISMCASHAHPTAPNASRNHQRVQVTDAATS